MEKTFSSNVLPFLNLSAFVFAFRGRSLKYTTYNISKFKNI